MHYLSDPDEIRAAIARWAHTSCLWLDTETADYRTSKPRLSLIQGLAADTPLSPAHIYVLDVLDQPDVVEDFITTIMANKAIQKVFHNAAFDRRYLGKTQAKNVVCTLTMAKAIPLPWLPVPNHQLKTLTEHFAIAPTVDKTEQGSDWGQRPLDRQQLQYASLDVLYLAQVHQQLQTLYERSHPDPQTEDIAALAMRYQQLKPQWEKLKAEFKHLEDRLKRAMSAQEQAMVSGIELQTSQRTTRKVSFQAIANYTQKQGLALDFMLTLNQDIQKKLGEAMTQLPIQEQTTPILKLKAQPLAEDELPF